MENEIAKLQREYIASFSEKETELRALMAPSHGDDKALAQALHKIAGSGGTYRMQALSRSTRALEVALLSGAITLSGDQGLINAWLRFFTTARKSYEGLAAADPTIKDCEHWHSAVGRIDTALQSLWEKVAKTHKALRLQEEDAA